tara:strand:- start:284 stop:469 length:186 start_codon:yes stop_codon:yes gene_type:complete
MSKLIRDKVGKMELSTIALFNNMTDEDFLAVHNAGQLYNLCVALSLDLNYKSNEKSNTYTA